MGQSRYTRLPRPAGKQAHFSEALPAAEPNRPRLQRHLDRPRCNEENGVAPIPYADDALVWDREARAQQPGHAIELPFVEARQDVEPFDQAMRVQSDIEARGWLCGARTGDAPLQIVMELLRDQPFLEQRLVS